ncbi:helix-turn-helix domain-containing protein [uncultured Marivirga sp.]|uniref:helix-turn-helix domain-containing protein n=1 Tax=uncultured Marivirga sp. TaxID=1123707 RepID=UPI0030ED703C|tara:strand:+ start:4257 stop:4541 length:285 start_codon:yes stop_codon:yes gene_type:complete
MKQQVMISMTTDDLENLIIAGVIKGLKDLKSQKSDSSENDLLSRQETASLLKISLVTLSEWTKTGILQSYQVGGRVYYKKSEVIQTLRVNNPKS